MKTGLRRFFSAAFSWIAFVILLSVVPALPVGAQFTRITNSVVATVGGNSTGVAWGDYDNDGDLDVFVARFSGQSNLLFRNERNGSFTNVTVLAGLDEAPNSAAAAWGDYDNDGFLDLFVANHGTNSLYHNNGDGTFSKITTGVIVSETGSFESCAWGDYNTDGYLDLFVANGTNDKSTNLLYRNKGDGTFEKMDSNPVTTQSGNFQSCAWGDYDNDGYLDLFVGAYNGTSALYHNSGNGTFTTNPAGDVGAIAFKVLGCAWGDFNNDGFLDLAVVGESSLAIYRNSTNGTFTKAYERTSGFIGWDCAWADYNNDGYLDLLVASDDKADYVLQNNGSKSFTRFPIENLATKRSFSCAWADYDSDGQLDFLIANYTGGENFLFRNNGTTNNWLTVKCRGKLSNRSAIGAKVRVLATIGGFPVWQMREISGGGGAGSQNSPVAHFGLGSARSVTMVRVEWPSGHIDELQNFGVNQELAISDASVAIVVHPLSQTVFPGTNVIFRVQAVGEGLTFQWRYNGAGITDATNATLVLQNVHQTDAGAYSVEVNNALGGSAVSSTAILTVVDRYGDEDGDMLANLLEVHFGTDMFSEDTDADGLTDYEEIYKHGTNPLLKDTDGDGVEDKMELESTRSPTFTGTRYSYDRIDRLIGVEYEKGLSIGYQYDGNGNIIRQIYLPRAAETNGMPTLWRFLNGIAVTNAAGVDVMFGDPDRDGWSNYQEWKAGTEPLNSASRPDIFGSAGINIGTLTLPFTPSNFVVGVGQLDGVGAEEIVIGADGNPGTSTNFLLILSQTSAGWTTERLDVGALGITSLAIGQPANREVGAIYLGLRQHVGSGLIWELRNVGGNWQTNIVASSTNDAAYVLGVYPGQDLIASLGLNVAPAGSLQSIVPVTGAWYPSLLDARTSLRGLGTVFHLDLTNHYILRLLDAGGIQVNGGPNVPTNSAKYYSGSWYFLTPSGRTWSNAQAYARQQGGNLVTIEDAAENSWIRANFPTTNWIGLYSFAKADPPYAASDYSWVSGSASTYRNFRLGEPSSGGQPERAVIIGWENSDGWDNFPETDGRVNVGIVEVRNPAGNFVITEPPATNRFIYRGLSLAAGTVRSQSANSFSVFYGYLDDKNASGRIDEGDDFVVSEFQIIGTNSQTLTLSRLPVSDSKAASSFGLATVNSLHLTNRVLFTGEPDGRVFSWSATNATGPLQRQLFSSHHAGKVWHALAGVKTLAPGEGLLGLRVDPANPNVCDVILWVPQSELPKPPDYPQTAPLTQIMPTPDRGGGIAEVEIRIWDAEGNSSLPSLQFLSPGSTVWSNATLVNVDGLIYGSVSALPTGVTHRLQWHAANDLGAGFTNQVRLRAQAKDITLEGPWSEELVYQVSVPGGIDVDMDGLLDDWERERFESLTQGPDDDLDQDGVTNKEEYVADTDPKDPDSHLRLSIRLDTSQAIISWEGGMAARQFLEERLGLGEPNEPWVTIWTNEPPTQPTGAFTNQLDLDGARFYRLRVLRE